MKMAKGTSISKFYKTFSGTDTIAFLMFPGIKPITIGSLTTVSYSMYRNKVPVINIGRTNINGITRGSRIYAGTMVFTLINKHWLRELQTHASYLQDYPTLKTDELPLFDIMIISANEYGNSCAMFIYGVDFTDEAQTVSVEDLFTENVFKFVAREISVFDEAKISAEDGKAGYYTVSTGILKNYYVDEQERQATAKLEREIKSLNRSLYYISNGMPMMGTDVAGVQQLLNMALKDTDLAITYKFDRPMDAAVREFQSIAGLIVNGVVDNTTYTKLLQYTKQGIDGEYVQIINKSGAYIYREPDTNSQITNVLPYLASVKIYDKVQENLNSFYQTEDGYLSTYDAYNYLDNRVDSFAYEQLQYGDTGPQVTILQNALEFLYENFKDYNPGVFDEKTEEYVKYFQQEHDLVVTGICDNYTWNILLNSIEAFYKDYVFDHKNHIFNHTEIKTTKEPGVYKIKENLDSLNQFQSTVTNPNTQQIKYSTIAVYDNEKTKTDSKTFTFSGSQTHSVDEFINMFKDDIQYQTPNDVYYIIYPYGSVPLKWHFVMEA